MPSYRRSKAPGATYFFTVNTYHRRPHFAHELARAALRDAIRSIRASHPFEIDAWILLPDHLHCLWTLPDGDADFSLRWSLIKRHVSKLCAGTMVNARLLTTAQRKNDEAGFWQRRFWEHQIRDDEDFARHADYIHWNPVKHGHAKRPADWPYSTFHRFVERGVYPANWAVVLEDEPQGFGE